MSQTEADTSLKIRGFEDADEAGVLELLEASLGGGPAGRRPPEFFRWKHLENPFGRSYMILAEADDRIVGLRAFMRWRFIAGDQEFRAVRAVDTATHPDYQGRGIFKTLTLRAIEELKEDTDLIFNTPNNQSLPGYLKMGWKVVGKVPVRVRVRRPGRVLMKGGLRRRRPPRVIAPVAAYVLNDSAAASLVEAEHRGEGLGTARSPSYMHWRYGEAPLLDYRAVAVEEWGDLQGFGIFRVRPRGRLWEATVAEVIVKDDSSATIKRVLAKIASTANVDHLVCHLNQSLARAAARRSWFLKVPGGITLVCNPLRVNLSPDPLDLSSWELSLGDLEVF